MTIYISGHSFTTELERLYGLFYPDEKVRFERYDGIFPGGGEEERTAPTAGKELPGGGEEERTASITRKELPGGGEEERIASITRKELPGGGEEERTASVTRKELPGGGAEIETALSLDGKKYRDIKTVSADDDGDRYSRELALADGLYKLLRAHTGYTPPWGMLTGVRPVKLLRMLAEDGSDPRDIFINAFHCSESKYGLALETARHEERILSMSSDDSFSLYISVPFCPTRCSYCSFVSQSVEKSFKLVPGYVRLLAEEIRATALTAKELGLKLETVYMGGGTPTTLSAEQLAFILGTVNECFDMSGVREMTVEAGRPDTVTPEKLQAIKAAGARRISINPQTMSDRVLGNIGRRHTVAQVYEAMDMARAVGFGCVNMDLIAGLTGDTPEGFGESLDAVLALAPENITVHTLAMKRASRLVTQKEAEPDAAGREAGIMLERCSDILPGAGYHPYYLYRQSHMTGNLENVGWSKDGHDGLYNVFIMDETHTILAVGAGGVTKLKQPGVNNIERVYNYKFPYEYIERFGNILERKKRVKEFYAEFC